MTSYDSLFELSSIFVTYTSHCLVFSVFRFQVGVYDDRLPKNMKKNELEIEILAEQ